MKNIIIFLLLLCGTLYTPSIFAQEEGNEDDTLVLIEQDLGYIFAVHDGDSYKMQLAEKVWIRLVGIDCPEIFSIYVTATQPFGRVIGDTVRSLIKGKVVTYKLYTHDKFGRTVAALSVNGDDLGLLLIRNGWAWYASPEKNTISLSMRRKYAKAQREAKSKGLGLWAGYVGIDGKKVDPIEPWKWRKINMPKKNK